MTEEEKILLKELCSRLPYRVKVHVTTTFPNKSVTESDYTLIGITKYVEGVSVPNYNHHRIITDEISFALESESDTGPIECFASLIDLEDDNIPRDTIKPYLRELSDMTKEEKEDYFNICDEDIETLRMAMDAPDIIMSHRGRTQGYVACKELEWLYEHHFDFIRKVGDKYTTLTDMGLALKAPKGMYNN